MERWREEGRYGEMEGGRKGGREREGRGNKERWRMSD